MKNPLNKRFTREIKSDLGKYIVLFVFITVMISLVSGFLVVSNSIIAAYDESFEKYNVEDGNFELSLKAEESLINTIEKEGVTLYENFYLEEETNLDTTMRVFINRQEVNKVCLMSGELPDGADEIAIDRVHAQNNYLKVGDKLMVGDKEFIICGLVALTDYSALFQSTTDTMFDAIKFGVGVTTTEGFESIGDTHIHYSYSWKYDESPADNIEAKKKGDSLMEALYMKAPLETFIPAYNNQAIQFTGNDMGRDSLMFMAMLYILVAIIAFTFAITTSNTIAKEATVIGTMRASGYTKGEMIAHYMAMPMLITIVAAILGNVLGYTVMTGYAEKMYYDSYCLTTYEVLWNAKAFIDTTVIPVVLMFLINFFILVAKFKLSSLKFIRRDLSKKKKKKALKLNTKIGIMKRFRLRIILQNMPNYITIFIGIFLANIIMVFGVAFPKVLSNYGDTVGDNMLSKYQYVLKMPTETEVEVAEKHTVYSLMTLKTRGFTEAVNIFGIEADSRYIDADIKDGQVFISSAYADKYGVKTGDTITLREEFEDKEYALKVDGIYDYSLGIALFMNREDVNQKFGLGEGFYNGYFTDSELTDVEENAVATIIAKEDMDKLTRQLLNSLGEAMYAFFFIGVLVFMLIIYLLSKIIIEKNSQSISMIKILGYTHKEINGLYVITTALVVIGSLILTMPVVNLIMKVIVEYLFFQYPGWMTYSMPASSLIIIVVVGILAYGIIAFFQMRKVREIPMEDALKNVE